MLWCDKAGGNSEQKAARSDNPGAFEAQAAAVFGRQCRDAGLATEIIPIRRRAAVRWESRAGCGAEQPCLIRLDQRNKLALFIAVALDV
jgi:hypothetical protein